LPRSLIGYTLDLKIADPLYVLSKAEEEFRRMDEDFKLPFIYYSILAPLWWTVPQSCLQILKNTMKRLGVSLKLQHTLSPLLLSPEGYTLLGNPVMSIYPHVRFGSVAESPRKDQSRCFKF